VETERPDAEGEDRLGAAQEREQEDGGSGGRRGDTQAAALYCCWQMAGTREGEVNRPGWEVDERRWNGLLAPVVRIGGFGGKLASVGFKALAMEPPRGFWDTALNFLKFLPYFIGLLILGVIKSPDVAVVVGVRRAVLAKRGR
jgi:hypothetical protein